MKVLGIESSCDETGVAIYDSAAGMGKEGLLGHALYSQVELHAEYGGVVPELASRDHVRKTIPLIRELLADSKVAADSLQGVAYTAGPGLAGALLVGASIGRALAWGWGIPAVAIHHMEGHLLAPLIDDPDIEFPFVALLVSGGHTQLIYVRGIGEYELLGESLDDAAGEAFDKTAKLMGLGYPGGPSVAVLAEQGRKGVYRFPRPMVDRPGLDFSFSGLKTFTVNTFQSSAKDAQAKADIAFAFEEAVVDTLVIKCKRALQQVGCKSLVVAGGVSANKRLRLRLHELVTGLDCVVHFPRPEFCTDNGAMIAYAGCLRLQAGETQGISFRVNPRWPLSALTAPTKTHS